MPAIGPWMGAVLAGGSSTRMGADKAFIEVEGVPMVARAAAALTTAGAASVLVVGGDQARLSALGMTAVADLHPGKGPLGGVITALSCLRSLDSSDGTAIEAVVTLPCDVVEPCHGAVRGVIDGLSGPAGTPAPPDLAVPLGSGVPQWMHAAWRRRCLPALSRAFAAGVRAPKEVAGLFRIVEVEIPGTGWFEDADCPEDLPSARIGRDRLRSL